MIKVYGITTCGSVKKALSFFKAKVIPYSFVDLKTTQISEETLEEWLSKQPLLRLFNTKGTKFKTLNLSKELSDEAKKEWLLKEQLLFKRPIVECEDGALLVGFDEELYLRTFSS
ncbi:arsenate reductase family protein [Sulfurospirillum barnesii]|uniref:Transcriptional regulator, Spx/MgsR family n=1 Tax=Sulfurospirillum barnesii (strain ATCC 700032 / DSM 10660 / SES-3) TaxID=760154 RepID=I3XZQ3_SULBS|nr:arsenate reductase family protein [Sulfurospirillum barnesii]AFL69427.1 transcriptional regulator, Spx/MgsR family [Sulfurospirillum barnesii SES-3]